MASNPSRICERCNVDKKTKEFNPAFGCCKECVTEADYDRVQPEISKLMRGFSPLEKQSILREALMMDRQRQREAKSI
jgi:hypothetical protein